MKKCDTFNIRTAPTKSNCSICFKAISKKSILTLPCGHHFHKKCFATREKNNSEVECRSSEVKCEGECEAECYQPLEGLRKLYFYKKGTTCVSCPICRTEYTRDLSENGKLSKIIAKVHAKDYIVHYITDMTDFFQYVPKSEITSTGTISKNGWKRYVL